MHHNKLSIPSSSIEELRNCKLSMKTLLANATMAFFLVGATTGAQAFTDAQYQDAIQHLQAGSAGDKAAIPVAVEKFTALVNAEPTNPLLLANLGAVTSMQSRTTALPWKKISFSEDGMSLQDKALGLLTPESDKELHKGTPVSLLVKFSSASTFLSVPGFFNRGDQGAKLIQEVMNSPMFASSSPSFRGSVWMRAARWMNDTKKPDEAKRYLQMVIDNNLPQAETARAQLAAPQ